MNSTTASSFFSRDVFLRRQARTTRKRSMPTKLCPSLSRVQEPLSMIEEEDEPRASTSRSPSPWKSSPTISTGTELKSKRRHANLSVSDVWLAKTMLIQPDSDFTQQNLLSSPRPANLSLVSGPYPFNLKSSHGSLRFPRPPIPTPPSIDEDHGTGYDSPTPSMSSSSTSPETQTSVLPMTPPSSDDESPYYYSPTPGLNPRRLTIKPLTITKHSNSPRASCASTAIPPSLSNVTDDYSVSSPLSFWEGESESESESDSEWYSREFSKILTLSSVIPSTLPREGRPDSLFVTSNPRPPTPCTPTYGFPSSQLDPSFPHSRRSRISVPNYPSPPVPTSTKRTSMNPSSTKTFRPCSKSLTVTPPRRPPPRSSIPADCMLVDDTFTFSDDSASAFSFSLYDASPTSESHAESPQSAYSQRSFLSPCPSPFPSSFPSTPSSAFPSSVDEEFDFEDVQFAMELDKLIILPLDLPTSPFDFAAEL
ncbi:hypothetical protein H0H87_003478 [Tephrocybe sp. NHM501043]|nr:hypothetical protein H0H87_003478 [Tephrocybe sp. NHM501043]